MKSDSIKSAVTIDDSNYRYPVDQINLRGHEKTAVQETIRLPDFQNPAAAREEEVIKNITRTLLKKTSTTVDK